MSYLKCQIYLLSSAEVEIGNRSFARLYRLHFRTKVFVMRSLCFSLVCFVMLGQVGFCQDSGPSTVVERASEGLNQPNMQETTEGYFYYQENPGQIELQNTFSNCECNTCQSCSQRGNKKRMRTQRPRRRCQKGNCGCQSKPALGFAVEEVQYGANAGLPSFGFISHGPWTTLEKRELLRRRHLLSRCIAKCKGRGKGKRGHKGSHGATNCGCADCQSNAGYLEPGFDSVANVPTSNEIPFDSNEEFHSYPLHSPPAEFELYDTNQVFDGQK